jgi:hypothetical protein
MLLPTKYKCSKSISLFTNSFISLSYFILHLFLNMKLSSDRNRKCTIETYNFSCQHHQYVSLVFAGNKPVWTHTRIIILSNNKDTNCYQLMIVTCIKSHECLLGAKGWFSHVNIIYKYVNIGLSYIPTHVNMSYLHPINSVFSK